MGLKNFKVARELLFFAHSVHIKLALPQDAQLSFHFCSAQFHSQDPPTKSQTRDFRSTTGSLKKLES